MVIEGFKSYKDQTILDPFSNKVNVVGESIATLPLAAAGAGGCGSLREALGALEADHEFLLAGDVFSKEQIESYIELKWTEVYRFEHTPHPVEFEMYYSA